MSSPIDKKTLEHLAELARIKLNAHQEEKLLHDLGKILDHFEELKEVDTANVAPPAQLLWQAKGAGRAGGSSLANAFREDGERENPLRGAGTESFPERSSGFLKVPPVFEE